jgi:peptidyl-prolyl cis-trans isomerase C
MKNALLPVIVSATALAAGCGRSRASSAVATNAAAAPQAPPFEFAMPLPPAPAPEAANETVVEVNGERLTRGDIEREVQARLAAMPASVPPERREQTRARLRDQAAEQFVLRTLLLEEADRRDIKVTPEDEARVMQAVQARLPAGLTVEEAMRKSPVGPDRMRAEMLAGVRIGKLAAACAKNTAEIGDAELAASRVAMKDLIARAPETVHARHILVRTDPADNETTRTRKRQKAEEIRAALVGGADFAETARKQSDCPSRQRGGDLGTFRREGMRMGNVFAEAAFNQGTNEIGAVVETPENGFHIIQVLEHNAAGTVPDSTLREWLREQRQRKALADLARELRSRAKITDYRLPRSPAQPARAPAGSANIPQP